MPARGTAFWEHTFPSKSWDPDSPVWALSCTWACLSLPHATLRSHLQCKLHAAGPLSLSPSTSPAMVMKQTSVSTQGARNLEGCLEEAKGKQCQSLRGRAVGTSHTSCEGCMPGRWPTGLL